MEVWEMDAEMGAPHRIQAGALPRARQRVTRTQGRVDFTPVRSSYG